MAKGDRFALFGCNSHRRYPEKYVAKDHIGFPGRFLRSKTTHTFLVLLGPEQVQELDQKTSHEEFHGRPTH